MRVVVVLALLVASWPTVVGAQSGCSFQNGFKALAEQIPNVVGRCLGDEYGTNSGTAQSTTEGVFLWRASDNATWFSSAGRAWVMTPDGVREQALDTPPQAAPVVAPPQPTIPVLPCWQIPNIVTPALKAQLDAVRQGINETRRIGGLPPLPPTNYTVTPQEIVNQMWAVCDKTAPAPPQPRLVMCTIVGNLVYCF